MVASVTAVPATESSDFNWTIKSFSLEWIVPKMFHLNSVVTTWMWYNSSIPAGEGSIWFMQSWKLCCGSVHSITVPLIVQKVSTAGVKQFHVDHWNWYLQIHPITRHCSSKHYMKYICSCTFYESCLTSNMILLWCLKKITNASKNGLLVLLWKW